MTTKITALEKELLEKILITDCSGYVGAYTEYAYASDIDMNMKQVTGLMMSLTAKGIIIVEDMECAGMESSMLVINEDFLKWDDQEEEFSLNNVTL